MERKTFLVLPLLLLAAVALPAQQSVTIKVHLSQAVGSFQPVWAWVGHDEPNYTYSAEGLQLLTQLSSLSSYPIHDRTHNLLTSGDGTPRLKWGSTNAFTRDANGKPDYNWTIVDKIFDAYKATGVKPLVEIGFDARSAFNSSSTIRASLAAASVWHRLGLSADELSGVVGPHL